MLQFFLLGARSIAVRLIGSSASRTVTGLAVRESAIAHAIGSKYVTALTNGTLIGLPVAEYFTSEELVDDDVENIMYDLASSLMLGQSVMWLKDSGFGTLVGEVFARRRKNFRQFVKKYPRPQGVVSTVKSKRPADMTRTWDKAFDDKTKSWSVFDKAGNPLLVMDKRDIMVTDFHRKRFSSLKFAGGTAGAATAMFELTDDQTMELVSDYLDFLVNTIYDTETIDQQPAQASSSAGNVVDDLSLLDFIAHPHSVYRRIGYELDMPSDHPMVEQVAVALFMQCLNSSGAAQVDVYNSGDVVDTMSKKVEPAAIADEGDKSISYFSGNVTDIARQHREKAEKDKPRSTNANANTSQTSVAGESASVATALDWN